MLASTAWCYLLVAGAFEIVWALGLKQTQGFTRFWPSCFVFITMGISFFCLAQAVRILPVSSAYAIWTGIGAVGTAIFGILFFGESLQIARILCIFLIIAGTVGLKILSR